MQTARSNIQAGTSSHQSGAWSERLQRKPFRLTLSITYERKHDGRPRDAVDKNTRVTRPVGVFSSCCLTPRSLIPRSATRSRRLRQGRHRKRLRRCADGRLCASAGCSTRAISVTGTAKPLIASGQMFIGSQAFRWVDSRRHLGVRADEMFIERPQLHDCRVHCDQVAIHGRRRSASITRKLRLRVTSNLRSNGLSRRRCRGLPLQSSHIRIDYSLLFRRFSVADEALSALLA